jgi:hypothetical protein
MQRSAASISATTASQRVEWLNSHVVQDTATACMKKLNHETIDPKEYRRKLPPSKASPMPPNKVFKMRSGGMPKSLGITASYCDRVETQISAKILVRALDRPKRI